MQNTTETWTLRVLIEIQSTKLLVWERAEKMLRNFWTLISSVQSFSFPLECDYSASRAVLVLFTGNIRIYIYKNLSVAQDNVQMCSLCSMITHIYITTFFSKTSLPSPASYIFDMGLRELNEGASQSFLLTVYLQFISGQTYIHRCVIKFCSRPLSEALCYLLVK